MYPEVSDRCGEIVKVLQKEEKAFARTLRKGLSTLRRLARRGETITAAHLFELRDTFGMPIELSIEEANRKSYSLAPDWAAGYEALLEEQRSRSRAAV